MQVIIVVHSIRTKKESWLLASLVAYIVPSDTMKASSQDLRIMCSGLQSRAENKLSKHQAPLLLLYCCKETLLLRSF